MVVPGLFFIGGYPGTARSNTYIYVVLGIETLLPGNARPADASAGLVFYGVRFECT